MRSQQHPITSRLFDMINDPLQRIEIAQIVGQLKEDPEMVVVFDEIKGQGHVAVGK